MDEPQFPILDSYTTQISRIEKDVCWILPRREWPKRVAQILDIYIIKASLMAIGVMVGSIEDWDCPVDTVWLSPRAIAELGVNDGEEVVACWSRTCSHGEHKVAQPVVIRVSTKMVGNEAMYAESSFNKKIYCRGFYETTSETLNS